MVDVTTHRRNLTIGVLSPVVGGFYFGKILAGISRGLRTGGHRVVAFQTYPADLDREEFPDRPPPRQVVGLDAMDGVIVVTSAVEHDVLRGLDRSGKPLVVISETVDDLGAPVVTPDNAGGVRAAVEHLLRHGHERIGFLGNPRQHDLVERHAAYETALRAHGIEPRPEWIYQTRDNQEAAGAAAGRAALQEGLDTTATVAGTDRNAVGFLRSLADAGLVLPRDQALIGFDHSDGGARSRPRLSSVDPHHDRVGELAAELLLARIHGEQAGPGQHLAEATLVCRESCGCVDSTRTDLLVDGKPTSAEVAEDDTAMARLDAVARAVLDDSVVLRARRGAGSTGSTGSGESAVGGWVRAVVGTMTDAAGGGTLPAPQFYRALADRTAVLRPVPEALELLVPAVRALEAELLVGIKRRGPAGSIGAVVGVGVGATRVRPQGRSRALGDVTTEILVALAKGCTHALLVRSGNLERAMVDQYELDLELMHADSASLRHLDWLPRGQVGPAAIALWSPPGDGPGGDVLKVVGVRGGLAAQRLVGHSFPAAQFPPRALLSTDALSFVIPVAFDASDWGHLVIGGPVDTRATSAREKYNHWAAMLAVALDQEDHLAALRAQRTELEEAALRERRLAEEISVSEERYALASVAAYDATWDWDVATGTVYYSPSWRAMLGLPADDLKAADPEEWLDRVHPEDLQAVQVALAVQLGGVGGKLDLEHRLLAADGRYLRVHCRAVTVSDGAGCPTRIVGVLTDCSDERRENASRAECGPSHGLSVVRPPVGQAQPPPRRGGASVTRGTSAPGAG
ncbi:substrate-binding domain-containing protein [Oerskovia sp. USHLN155]|uniref:substrate-binding domain-containing protein n=1 Tax=Oerskovia sp. USHLN155 TaxID=3081288 RepID=UPI003017B2AF